MAVALTAGHWLLAEPATAHFSAGHYTYSGSCTEANRVDPVTVVLYGSATGARVLNHVQHHGGWTHQSGSPQNFLTHGQCYAMSGQRANDDGLSSRWHVRVRTTYHGDDTWGTTAMGSPHRDELVWCIHAVPPNGFNAGRTQIVNMLSPSPHHTYSHNAYWGNTQSMKQCTGSTAASNGYVAWISMPAWDH
jgi:hypothetical protein